MVNFNIPKNKNVDENKKNDSSAIFVIFIQKLVKSIVSYHTTS